MATSSLTAPHFTDEDAARAYLEGLRWPDGRICPHCAEVGRAYAAKRLGKYRCAANKCRKDFTVKVGTVFEASHIPLHNSLLAAYLLAASKKGMSSHQLMRMLGVTYKTARFMMLRLCEAMKAGTFTTPMGGDGKGVEVDETFIGKKSGAEVRRGYAHKNADLSLVEHGGRVMSFHVDGTRCKASASDPQGQHRRRNPHNDRRSRPIHQLKKHFVAHGFIRRGAEQWRKGDAYTNTLEGFFSVFKRGLIGVYRHCCEQHLHRYPAEFDFRCNHRAKLGITDLDRTHAILAGIEGKRLTYRRTGGAQAA